MKKLIVLCMAMSLVTVCDQPSPSLLSEEVVPDLIQPQTNGVLKEPVTPSVLVPDVGVQDGGIGPDLINQAMQNAVSSTPTPVQDQSVMPKKKKKKKAALDQVPSAEQQAISEPAPAEQKQSSQETANQVEPQAGKPFAAQEYQFDVEKKRKATIDLVERAAQLLGDPAVSLEDACNKFTHTKEFINGDLYIFVYDMQGTALAHGEDSSSIWSNRWDLTDWVGTKIVQEIIKKAKAGSGWVTYGWHNTTKISYVKRVDRAGASYAIGSGYYPQSKEEAVVNLVKGGVALFNEIKKIKQPADWAFSRLSYPSGRFVAGNLYLYALDFQGNIVAQGERPGLIGSNAMKYKDEKGLFVNREIIKKLELSSDGVWVEYISKRAKKRAYAEKVIGLDGKKYFIACGYYPDANRDRVEDLVRSGYKYMKTGGKTDAVNAFESRSDDTYRYGDLYLVVYDLKGKVIVNGDNSEERGQDKMEDRDDDGHLYIKNMVENASKEGSWFNAKVQGSFESSYAQRIDLGLESFVIVCSYYPVSKSETLILLVQSAVTFLRDNKRDTAFAGFVKKDGNFHRGDLQVVVVDAQGLCYAYGDDTALIWRNLLNVADDDGRPFIKQFINRAEKGSDFVKIKLNRAEKINYVSSLEKDGKTYVISSGFYQ